MRWRQYDRRKLTPEQSRAARGWLDWSQDNLANRANVSLSTVRDFELGRHIPIAINLNAIMSAIEPSGITCEADGEKATGIRINPERPPAAEVATRD